MNTRLFAVLFIALFLIGALPVMLVQPFGPASAGITAGFMLPADDIYHVTCSIAIGLLASFLGAEAMLILPLCALLMLVTGSLVEIDEHDFPAVHSFIIGSILLFSICVSLLRHKSLLLWIPPIAAYAYYAGGGFMSNIPSITTPLFFMIGTALSSVLLLGIGVALGITLSDKLRDSFGRFKNASAFTTFMSFF